MRIRVRGATILGLAVFLAAGGPAWGQSPAPPEVPGLPAGAYVDHLEVSWVLVPVVARNRSGFASKLRQKDFRLEVDGRPVPIESFEARSEAPLSVVLLQDLSGSMALGGKLEASRRALSYLVHHRMPGDEFAVADFAGGWVGVEVPFTSDPEPLLEVMSSWRAYGTTALHDAVAWVPKITAVGRNPKRAVVLVTDGLDNASVRDPSEVREILQRASLPVYVLGLDPDRSAETVGRREAAERYAQLLELLAERTGGRYIRVHDVEDIEKESAGILADLRNQYVLGFQDDPGGQPRFRRIRVEVRRHPKLRLAVRAGYRGGPPQSLSGDP